MAVTIFLLSLAVIGQAIYLGKRHVSPQQTTAEVPEYFQLTTEVFQGMNPNDCWAASH